MNPEIILMDEIPDELQFRLADAIDTSTGELRNIQGITDATRFTIELELHDKTAVVSVFVTREVE